MEPAKCPSRHLWCFLATMGQSPVEDHSVLLGDDELFQI